ncbi:MAG: helix-turn-helix transcriptional regulator [Bifidobacteriaceae bacterium]|nr:helix-turn-helix transcriptional regulator [Bifidobacteriaceae bacterium]
MANEYQAILGKPDAGQRLAVPPGLVPPPPIPIRRLRTAAQGARATTGLSINDLVMASGLSRTAVLDLLNGRGRIASGRLDTWWALAWALNMPMGSLMASLDAPAEDAPPQTGHQTTTSTVNSGPSWTAATPR